MILSPPPPPPPPLFGIETMIGSAAAQVLRRSNAAALLALSLLLGLAAPNEAYAQQGCQVGTAKHRAELKFDHHRQADNGKLTVATAAYRALIALGETTLPAWTGNNISGNAPTIAISATDLSKLLTHEGLNPQEPNGWRIIVNELKCVESGLPAITISGGPEATEGADAQFTVNVSRASGSAMTVNLKVEDVAGSDFVASGNEGRQTVSIPANQTSATYPVPIVNDESDEANGYVTVTVVGGGVGDGYTFTPGASARVWVSDSNAGQVFVSNIDQTAVSAPAGLNRDRAQAFTTGSHKSGYTLKSVDVYFNENQLDDLFRTNNPRLTATIRNDSGGNPGTIVGALNLPRSSPIIDEYEPRTITFRAPAKGIKLSPSTTYFFVIDVDATNGPGNRAKIRLVSSDAENAGGAAGFSIADDSRDHAFWLNPPEWVSASGRSMRISVKGEPNPFTDLVQMKNATRAIAEFGNHRDNGGVRFIVEIGDRLSPKGYARTINYTVGGSAERGEGKDYTIDGCTSSTCSVKLPANRHSVPITIYVNNDGIDENDETIVLTLKDGSGYTVNRNRTAPDNPLYTYDVSKLTIRDDDTRGLTFHRRWPDVPEGGSRTYTVKLKSQPTEPVEVFIASNNPDVTTTPTSLLFNPTTAIRWDTAQTVTVHAAHDSDAVDDEATLTYTTSGGDYGGAGALSIERPVSVDDDDTADPTSPRLPRISLEGGPAVTEGAAASFTVNADPAPTSSLTVSVEVFEPPGQDFLAASQERVRNVVLNAGATSTTFTVPTVNDGTDEDDGAVQGYVNDGTGYVAGQGAAVTVRDNDDPIPGAFFRSASSDAVEHGGTHEVRVELNYPAPSGGLTLRYSLSGTATAGSSDDFTIQNSGTVSIAARGASATIPVAINDDSAIENAETVILTLIGGSGHTVGNPSVHTLTIEDNDSTSASFALASSSADEDAGTHNVTVNLSQAAPAGGLTINYSVTGTATAGSGSDFTIQNSGSLSIAAGETSANIPVALLDDSAEESAETVILALAGGTGYTLGSATTHTLTITDNDGITAANLHPSSNTTTLPEGAAITLSAAFTFEKQLPPGGMATLPLTIGGTATLGTDYRLTCGSGKSGVVITCSGLNGNSPSITFDGSGSTRTVRQFSRMLNLETLEDNTSESDETLTLTLGRGNTLTITITDAPSSVSVSFNRATYSVDEGAGVFQQIFDMSAASGRDIALPLIYTDVTATGGADYTRLGQAVLKANGTTKQSLPPFIPILEDKVHEGDESFRVAIDTANLPAGVTAGSITEATITIVDNDAANTAYFALGSSRAAESAGTHNVTVNLSSAAPSGGLTLNYSVGGSATAGNGNDFTIQGSGTVTIAEGTNSANIPVAINDDSATESAETVILTLTGGTGYTLGSPKVHTLTITDNDGAGQPAASFDSGSSSAAEGAGTRNVRVNLSPAAPSGGLTLAYGVSGTATAGSGNDFTIRNSGTLSVTAGTTTADIPVAINDDSTEEGDETVVLTLTGGTGYTLGGTTAHTLTITDNDNPGTACASSSLLADVGRRGQNGGNERWTGVLNALTGQPNAITLAEVREIRNRIAWYGRPVDEWDAVIGALECMIAAQPPGVPVVGIAGDDGNGNGIADSIDEGGTARFTLTATPAPAGDLVVAVDVKNINIGVTDDANRTRRVTIGTGGTAVLEIVTEDDSKQWPLGTVYVAVQPGVGHRVAAEPDNAASVSVEDNDTPKGMEALTATAVDEPLPPPSVAHWKFDGDTGDSAGSSGGAVMNGAYFTTAARVGSHALVLDGVDDYVDLTPHASSFPLGNSARSISGWFKADAGNQRQTFLTYGPNIEGKRLSIAADRTQALVAVSGHAWGVNNLSLAEGWHHIAVTFAGGQSDDFSIYLDGALQSASTLGGFARQVDTRTGTAAIGRNVGDTVHYGGEIDDVRLYDFALSLEQVRVIAAWREGVQPSATAIQVRVPMGLRQRGWSVPGMSGSIGARPLHGVSPTHSDAVDMGTPTLGVQAHVPLLPGASNPLRGGLVRIVNSTARAGGVRIVAVDDAGRRNRSVELGMGAGETVEFTSRDLEWGNAAMGLVGTGPGTGDWRLEIASDLDDIVVLPYVRSHGGMPHAMGDVAPVVDDAHRVALFHPADGVDATGRLRLTNRGAQALRAEITGVDDTGSSPDGMVSVEIGADESVLLTAAELEAGGSNLLGALGDGEGQWRLDIASDGDLAVMNLVETSDGNLTNLSGATATTVPAREAHVVDRFPSSADMPSEQGVLRIVNNSGRPASVRIEPNDSAGWRHAPLTLTLGAGEAANLGTWDLELGNAAKGLSGIAGPGTGGPWRLSISSDRDIEVLTYVRSPSGLPRRLGEDAPER